MLAARITLALERRIEAAVALLHGRLVQQRGAFTKDARAVSQQRMSYGVRQRGVRETATGPFSPENGVRRIG